MYTKSVGDKVEIEWNGIEMKGKDSGGEGGMEEQK